MSLLNSVAAVIRTWSNNETIRESVCRALEAGIGHVIVVVKDEDPKLYGAVERHLADEIVLYPGRLHIITMRIGYGWSAALNVAFEDVRQLNELAEIENKPFIEFVLNVSNEVRYTRDDIEAMVAEMENAKLGAVGTSFRGLQNDIEVPLGKTYRHPRNTMMLVRFRSFLAVGAYDTGCDRLGGMEDLQWLGRLRISGGEYKLLDRRVTLLIGLNHNQAEKEAREQKAVEAIGAQLATLAYRMNEFIR